MKRIHIYFLSNKLLIRGNTVRHISMSDPGMLKINAYSYFIDIDIEAIQEILLKETDKEKKAM